MGIYLVQVKGSNNSYKGNKYGNIPLNVYFFHLHVPMHHYHTFPSMEVKVRAKILWVENRKSWIIQTEGKIPGKTVWYSRQEVEDCEFFNQEFHPLSKIRCNKKTITIKNGWGE